MASEQVAWIGLGNIGRVRPLPVYQGTAVLRFDNKTGHVSKHCRKGSSKHLSAAL